MVYPVVVFYSHVDIYSHKQANLDFVHFKSQFVSEKPYIKAVVYVICVVVVVGVNTTVSQSPKESVMKLKGFIWLFRTNTHKLIFIAKTWRNVEYSLYVSTVAPSTYCGCKEA